MIDRFPNQADRLDLLTLNTELTRNDLLGQLTVFLNLSDQEVLKRVPFLNGADTGFVVRKGQMLKGDCLIVSTVPTNGQVAAEYGIALPDAQEVIKLDGEIKVGKETWGDY